jgi:hypothetical protein
LFDNGSYSLVSGFYGGEPAIGERWNGQADQGYPTQGGNPLWHVVPEFLRVPILHGLLDEFARHPGTQSEDYASAIIRELNAIQAEAGRVART